MGFGEAVSTCLSKYVVFSGRARRSEYWYWWLFTIVVGVLAAVADNLLGWHITSADPLRQVGWLASVAGLFLLLPTLAVTFRRLHDTGRSGWWWVLSLVCCIGQVLLFFFCLSDSRPGVNQYGPNPKAA